MKRIGCVECGSGITLLRGINCRVIDVEREHGEFDWCEGRPDEFFCQYGER